MSKKNYTSEAIEVLTGLEPVQKRPGMYTDVTRPNHLTQEVVDNSVDEAIAGHASRIDVILEKDGVIEVSDDGRGMPVDVHPEHKVPGIELILSRLHAGAKFSNKNYKYSGGLHGVGVSVVNALSSVLEAWVKRDGFLYYMKFENGALVQKLKKLKKIPKKEHGTTIRFLPNKKYFDFPKVAVAKFKQLLKAKAVLCPGLTITLDDKMNKEQDSWRYEDGLKEYFLEQIGKYEMLPAEAFQGEFNAEQEEVSWVLAWAFDKTELLQESYVNLVPTIQGGTHVNGLRTGLSDAMREFCEIHNLLPKGIKLSPEDTWLNVHFVLSMKMEEAHFSGQTKERLASRQSAAFVSGVVKDSFSLWLNEHVHQGTILATKVIENAQKRLSKAKQVVRKKVVSGPALPGKLADCSSQDLSQTELFLVEGDSAGGSAKQARDRAFQAIMPLRGKILNTWEVKSEQVLASQTINDISVALGIDPGSDDLTKLRYGKICILADADSDGLHIATLLCALFLKHFTALVKEGHVFIAMPPLYRIDVGKSVYYALDDDEKQGILDRIAAEHPRAKPNIQRFKGLGEMNPMQLRETTMTKDTRRLVQLTMTDEQSTNEILDMLLSKKRSSDRKNWLEEKGDGVEL